MTVGYLLDERFLRHKAPKRHPECPERLQSIQEELTRSGLLPKLARIEARPASREELCLAHDPHYLDRLEAALARGQGFLDPDTFFNEASREAALLAAGGTIDLALAIAKSDLSSGAAFVRPPGHHATRDTAMGFCLLNNIALAARALIAKKLASRPMILDWDVHHGNGTEDIFWNDPDVFFLSLHQFPLYPGTGRISDIGGPEAKGATLNIPLPPGSGDQEYLSAWDKLVVPAARSFQPDFLLISAGYDAYEGDPLAGMQISRAGFLALAERARALMEPSGGKILAVLEGGYDVKALGILASDLVRVLLGERTFVSWKLTSMRPEAAHVIAEVERLHAPYWRA